MLYIIAKGLFRYCYSIFNIKKLINHGFKNKLKNLRISEIKKSDTLFVLGSGSSINSISNEGWNHITNGNSIGLNFWPIHEFVPTFLMFEMPRGSRGQDFYEILSLKKEKYQNVPMIFKGLYKNRADFGGIKDISKLFPQILLQNIYLGREISIPGRNEKEFMDSLNYLNKIGFFSNKGGNINTIAQYRGSVTCAIIFGIKAGYKKIVLCGVDLNDTKYFYEEKADFYKEMGIKTPSTGQVGAIHKTNIKLPNVLSISKAIKLIDDFFYSNFGGRIYISNKRSALFPDLEFYNLSDED